MSTFLERKAERAAHYEKYVKGWRQVDCGACAGSGYYDHDGSPSCGWCGGSGKEFVAPGAYGYPKRKSDVIDHPA